MKSTLPPLTLFVGILGLSAAHAKEGCTWDGPLISEQALPVSLEKVNNLQSKLTGNEILEQLGPAARDVGSGLHVLQWDLTNGQVFAVSISDVCALPLHREAGSKRKS